jgi:NAD(P)-dependent dehydrogenase (short-subunit alcohol dehydrogenase family)
MFPCLDTDVAHAGMKSASAHVARISRAHGEALHMHAERTGAGQASTAVDSTRGLSGRVVVVTGASAGIGRATARAFARAGARVALLARNQERLDAACDDIRALGGEAMAIALDVADAEAVDAAATRIEREMGPIAVWVNNAMVTMFARFDAITPEEFARVTTVTYLGTVHGTMAALRRMRARDCGSIVQVGSALAYRSIPLQSPYCGAKAAIRGFTDALRSELIHDRSQVRLHMVQLSAFNTPQFDWARSRLPQRLQPVPPIFQPELAAQAIVRAAQSGARESWVGWPAVKAILSTRIVPGLGDWLAARSAYEGQETGEPADASRPDNLFTTVDGPQDAHGRFDARAKSTSLQMRIAAHRSGVLAAVGVTLLVVALLVAARAR